MARSTTIKVGIDAMKVVAKDESILGMEPIVHKPYDPNPSAKKGYIREQGPTPDIYKKK